MLVYERLRARPLSKSDFLCAWYSYVNSDIAVTVYVLDDAPEFNLAGTVEEPESCQRLPPRHHPKD